MFKNWVVQTANTDEKYLYVWHKGRNGQIVIKAEDEGYVVDIYDADDELVSSTYAMYNELEVES